MVYRKGEKVDSSEELESDKDSGNKTTLIPKSLLPEGAKIGDEVRLKIVHSYGDELEVQYSRSDKSKDDNVNKEPKSDEMEMAESELDAMVAPTEA